MMSIRHFIVTTYAVCCVAATAADSTLAVEEGAWKIWSPRPATAPKGILDKKSGELRLEGRGNQQVFGGWERSYPGVQPENWYRFSVKYRASGLGHELLQVPIRIDWLGGKKQRVGWPDYTWQIKEQDGWRVVTTEVSAPENANAAKVQLFLLNAPNAILNFKDVAFERIEAPSPRNVKIATVRLRPQRSQDPVGEFIQTINDQVKEKVDIILLPEGATVVGTGKTYWDVAEPIQSEAVKRLGELARKHQAWVVAGVYEKDGAILYNTSVLIDRSGNLKGKYRKVYIPREELEAGITPGNEFPVFDTDFGKVGMMICWDSQYADPARALTLRGAELILMPIWGGNEILTRARAIENHVFVASSGYDFPSLVIDPLGTEIVRTEQNGTVAITNIDLNRRYNDRWLGNMRGRIFRDLRSDVQINPFQK